MIATTVVIPTLWLVLPVLILACVLCALFALAVGRLAERAAERWIRPRFEARIRELERLAEEDDE